MKAMARWINRIALPGFALAALAACGGSGGGGSGGGGSGGGGNGGGGDVPAAYAISGTVNGLTGSGLVLHNGAEDLAVLAAGSFIFPTALAAGASYAVTVKSQPSAPSQDCVVANSSGTVGGANVTNVTVSCSASTGPKTYTVGGSVSGLTGSGLILANGSDAVSPAAGAMTFIFATALVSGSSYAVTVNTQPNGELCQVANGTGQIGSAAVTNVMVTCMPAYTVGGSISGLTAPGLVLANGSDLVSPAAGAMTFRFATALASGSSFAVTVQTQPNGERCQVANGTGQIGSTAVTNVIVTCVPAYTVGGSISGLTAPGLVLANWTDMAIPRTVSLTGAKAFTFPTALVSGSSYAVTVQTQPKGELCQVANGTGRIGSAPVTNVKVTCAPAKYTIGGSISGLTASGLVLANGGDTVSPAAGTTSFVFTTHLADGWSYAVTVTTQPNGELCQVGNGTGLIWSNSVTSVLVRCSRPWTSWVSGANTANASGVYGTQGIAAADNMPGARRESVTWVDNAGDLWLFGGYGVDSAGNFGYLNDLWQYSPGSRQWTWVSGANTHDAPGVYGTQGLAAAGNVPGARYNAVSWIDSAGNLWLFGGCFGINAAGVEGDLNDLWRYNPGNGRWTWVSGANTRDAPGVYGTQGLAAAGNAPGARCHAVSWIDSAGDLWLFGGSGIDSSGSAASVLNDLWRYSPASAQWTWVSGSNTVWAPGVYGTQGVAAVGNVPGARLASVSWIDSAGDLWLFGGAGSYEFNDLWRYSPTSAQWTWVSGSNSGYAQGVYGTQGLAAVGNMPGARDGAVCWIDSAGDLWLFGGNATVSIVNGGVSAVPNDLWRYSPGSGQWTWVSGGTVGSRDSGGMESGVYGMQGGPGVPGGRQGSVSWIDSAGKLWLFGGAGWDGAGNLGMLNDLWMF